MSASHQRSGSGTCRTSIRTRSSTCHTDSTRPDGTAILIRGRGEPGALTSAVREAVQATDPDQPVFGVQTMEQSFAQQRWPYRVFGTMFTIFAIIALVLSSVGIYAVTAYSVTQRTQEIGVRMALGAQPRQVSWLILRQGLLQLVIGLALGTAGASGRGAGAADLLVQIKPSDPVTLAGIGSCFTMVTVCACLIPARRATRLDPLQRLADRLIRWNPFCSTFGKLVECS